MGSKEIKDIYYTTNDNLSRARSIYHLVRTQKFVDAYNQCSDLRKEDLVKAIESNNLEELRSLLKILAAKDLGEMSLRELREIASEYRIPYYAKMSKSTLIQLIEKEEAT